MNRNNHWTRRDAIKAAAAIASLPLPAWSKEATMLKRPIPKTGEELPVIGLGTYNVFDVASTAEELAPRREIVDLMIEKGASLIDSSPMYNRAEKVVGDIIEQSGKREKLFLATKVWTDGKASGEQQMAASAKLMQADVIDLMQVHNLRDLDVHMATIRDWQQQGRIRYNGITDYRASALDELEAAMHKHRPQFIQINYSLGETEADRRVLPLASDLGIAVIANRPFQSGPLFSAVRGRELPGWATDFAASWGQFFLKFIVSHPSVTVAIPATSKPHHMADNLGAGFGEMPDAATRKKMAAFFASL
ncbi:MAG: aldo/keto reductase [Gammaproteobacteria bacterium]|nr:aldo/keto reductase [Gammaproteobacteria bacterium]MDH4314939.1 aldo/keto reductase [Gammaproteobacteria bacterium]MDH5214180.1 aldo/keto reductase [Gammaproteobacteria bacterium]